MHTVPRRGCRGYDFGKHKGAKEIRIGDAPA